MPITIFNTLASSATQSNLSIVRRNLQQSMARLSSGSRINSAADDAAGLGISESMNAQMRSLAVNERNALDGISMGQTAEVGAGEIADKLARMKELAVQAGNGVLNDSDRANLNTEYSSLSSEVNRIAQGTKFNGQGLLDGSSGDVQFQVTGGEGDGQQIGAGTFGTAITASGLGIDGTNVLTQAGAGAAMTSIDTAIKTVSTFREGLGSTLNRLFSATDQIRATRTNMESFNRLLVDTDVVQETANLSKAQVLSQGGYALLAQANQAPQLALRLLG